MTTTSTRPSPDLDRTKRVESEEDAIERLKDSYWRRYDNNPDIRAKLAGKSRTILLDVPDGNAWTFRIEDGALTRVAAERPAKPDVTVTVNRADLLALYNGELKAVQAYMSKRVRVKAGFRDMLFAKSLLGW